MQDVRSRATIYAQNRRPPVDVIACRTPPATFRPLMSTSRDFPTRYCLGCYLSSGRDVTALDFWTKSVDKYHRVLKANVL